MSHFAVVGCPGVFLLNLPPQDIKKGREKGIFKTSMCGFYLAMLWKLLIVKQTFYLARGKNIETKALTNCNRLVRPILKRARI